MSVYMYIYIYIYICICASGRTGLLPVVEPAVLHGLVPEAARLPRAVSREKGHK